MHLVIFDGTSVAYVFWNIRICRSQGSCSKSRTKLSLFSIALFLDILAIMLHFIYLQSNSIFILLFSTIGSYYLSDVLRWFFKYSVIFEQSSFRYWYCYYRIWRELFKSARCCIVWLDIIIAQRSPVVSYCSGVQGNQERLAAYDLLVVYYVDCWMGKGVFPRRLQILVIYHFGSTFRCLT